MGYQIALLLTNRQIFREAWGIFHLENFWTIVRVNKAGFAKEMKDRNFPVGATNVATADSLWRHGKFPVMKVTVNFPSLADQKQSDVLVVATAHLKSLVRALWTAKGASEMEVMVHVLPPKVPKSPSEGHLLRPFLKLRSIRRLVVVDMSHPEHVDRLTRAVTTTRQIFGELMEGAKGLQEYIEAKQWGLAAEQEEEQSILMTDCLVVYGNRFMDSRAGKEILITTIMSVAEMSLYRDQYARTISFADYALGLVSRPPVSQNIPAVQPAWVTFWERKTKCHILLIRARAYMGMRQAEGAFSEIEKAREIMPNSAELASISEAWRVMFGPSAPTPTAS